MAKTFQVEEGKKHGTVALKHLVMPLDDGNAGAGKVPSYYRSQRQQ